MTRKKWTAGEVVDALRRAYVAVDDPMQAEEWALLTEVLLRSPKKGMGGKEYDHWYGNNRTIDVLLTRNWGGGIGHRRIAVEVKVSRSDYRNETDEKRAPAEASAHQCYYAAPAGLIDPLGLPPYWGLFEVYPDVDAWRDGKGWDVGNPLAHGALIKVRKRPVDRVPSCNMDYLVSAAMRRACRAEERIRRGADDAAKVPLLEQQVTRLEGQLERRDEALSTAKARVRHWQGLALAVEGMQECADCRHPIRWKESGAAGVWLHTDHEQERACYEARAEANRLAKQAEQGVAYMRGWPDPVEPLAVREAQQAEAT